MGGADFVTLDDLLDVTPRPSRKQSLWPCWVKVPHYLLQVVEVEGKGRGVVAQERIPTGAFVCEYEVAVTCPKKDRPVHEEENGEGCYVLDMLTRDSWMCLDATRSFSSVGRLLDHAARSVATLIPLQVSSSWWEVEGGVRGCSGVGAQR